MYLLANTIIKFKRTSVLNFSEIHFCQEIPFKDILAHMKKLILNNIKNIKENIIDLKYINNRINDEICYY